MAELLEHNLLRGAIGMAFLIFLCYLLSNNRNAINWKLVLLCLFAQVEFAMGVLHTTLWGMPVFWLTLAVILLWMGVNKALRTHVGATFTPKGILLISVFVLVTLIGLIGAIPFFGKWSNLSVTISLLLLFYISITATKKGLIEALKWGLYASLLVITGAVLFGYVQEDLFRQVLQSISGSFVDLINISHRGTEFLFGSIADDAGSWGYIFAVQVLPNIIFFAALSSVLYYLGILQIIVYIFAYLLNKLKISGAESLSTAANIFLGQTEAPLMIRPYLEKLTRSEILLIMVGGMANTAGSVMAAYVGFLGGSDVDQQNFFALHMLSQSIMSAPAAILVAKMLFPQTNEEFVSKDLSVPKEKLGDNFLDALSLGTTDGLKLAVNVGAMLIVFTAMMWVANSLLGWVGDITHLNESIASGTDGRYEELSLQMLLGYIFSPVAWMIGVNSQDMIYIGQLLGEKTILNEFVAYISLGEMKNAGLITDPKSLLIATYSLCGFANFASIGIQIGGISQLAPNQRKNLTELGVKALIGGTIACMMCGCIAGALF
jgi:CNT family concentrative nucleoside transporter